MRTDCPTHTVPGRWMNPGWSYVAGRPSRLVVFRRPKISWHTLTAVARSSPSTSYDRIQRPLPSMSTHMYGYIIAVSRGGGRKYSETVNMLVCPKPGGPAKQLTCYAGT